MFFRLKMLIRKMLGMLGFKKTCPQCGGVGLYWTEVMARYNDDGVLCDMCRGTGRILYR